MLEDEILVCDQFDILNESKSFQDKLYSKKEELIREQIIENLSHFEILKLTTKESAGTEGQITDTEVLNFL